MKHLNLLIKSLLLLLIIALLGYFEYLCWSNVGNERDAISNIVLISSGVSVPILTLYLTLDFKTQSSNSK